MTTKQRVALAIGSMWPLAYLVVFLVAMNSFDLRQLVGPPPLNGLPLWFVALLGLHGATILVGGAVTVFDIWYVFKGNRVPRGRRPLWVVALACLSIVAIVPFFWLYIRPEKGEVSA